jgi:hypothetical protein
MAVTRRLLVLLTAAVVGGSASAAYAQQAPAAVPPPAQPAAQPATTPATTPAPAVKSVDPLPGTPWNPDYTGSSAHVIRRDNTDIYIMSKPDRPYVVTGRIVSEGMPATTDELSGQIILRNVTIMEMVDDLLALGRKRQIYYNFPYDALLTFDGQVGTFVRYRNKPAAPVPPTDTSSTQQP